MEKNQLQGLILMLTVVGLAALGVVIVNQNRQIAQLSKTLISLQLQQPTTLTWPEVTPISNPTPAPVPTTIKASNLLDPSKNRVGDTVAGLKIVSIGPILPDRILAQDNVHAVFAGEITLTGTYDYDMDAFAGDERVCFTVDNLQERQKLPVLVGAPDQNQRFCFNNFDKAKQSFAPTHATGTATIVIDSFELRYAPAEVVNGARLVSVLSKNDGYGKAWPTFTIPQVNLSFRYPSEWGTPSVSIYKPMFEQSGTMTFSNLGKHLLMGWNPLEFDTNGGREMSDFEIAQQDNPTAKCSALKDLEARKSCIQGTSADGHSFMIYTFKNPFTDIYDRKVVVLQTGNKQYPTFAAEIALNDSTVPVPTLEAVFKSMTVGK